MEKILIYDIETKTFGRPDPKKDELKVFGAYSYITNKYYCTTSYNDIKKLLDNHDIIVGFNSLTYDNGVLQRYFKEYFNSNKYEEYFFKNKINIDLFKIFKQRANIMKTKKGMLGDLLMSYSLDFITQTLDLVKDDGKIKTFNYDLLKKDSWTTEEVKTIKEYTLRDIEITKKLYEWCEDYFSGFKDFISEYDVRNKKYLTSAPSVFAYKAICKSLDWEEKYSDNYVKESYGGGYVSYPAGEEFSGDIYVLDFNSLYPHIMIQCNLYSPKKDGWNGGKFKVEGYYNNEHLGEVEKLLKHFYNLRLEYKKNKDNREYTIKIIINTIYGLLGNGSFANLYNNTSAADCTRLGRQWVKLARKKFRDAGFDIIYTDTDSVYIRNKNEDKTKMLQVKDEIIKEIKDNVPFPQNTFDMGVDDEISNIWFFKGQNKVSDDESELDEDDFINKPKGLMKKNYIYVTKDNRVVYKNLGVKKKSTSALTRKIFRDYLIPKIIEERKVKFSKSYFFNLIKEILSQDISLAKIRYQVKRPDEYKSKTSIQYQIAKKYGSGIHFMIKNTKTGVGEDKKYCTIEEFKKNNMSVHDLDYDVFWSELGYFIKDEKMDLSNFF